MDIRAKVNLIIYRFRERGLEVFLMQEEDNKWTFPQGSSNAMHQQQDSILLDAASNENKEEEQAMAVEGDWHEIPSLKSMLVEDALQLKEKLKGLESGVFVSLKDALKQAMPHQYAFLKELKDVLSDRNSLRDL